MIEIERKILNVDVESLSKKIIELGAEQKFSGKISTKYFDYPDGRIKQNNELLRVRLMEGKTVELVYKCDPKVEDDCKILTEKELQLSPDQFDNTCDFLTSLGFVQTMYFEKKRTQFVLGSTKFEIDEYPMLDPLLEIEAESASEIDEMIAKLELTDNEQSHENINQLFARLHPSETLDGLTL